MTDRERLNELAQQSMVARKAAVEKSERERAAACLRVESERDQTDELFQWCNSTFSGYCLPETGHSISVSKMPWSNACNVQVYFGDTRLPSWTECVGLTIDHSGPETHHIRRSFLLVLVMSASTGYEVVTEYKCLTLPTTQAVHDHLLHLVADLGAVHLQGVLEKFMKSKFWREA